MEIFRWRIGTGMNFRISELIQMEIFRWRIGTGMKFRISELSDVNISLEDWFLFEL